MSQSNGQPQHSTQVVLNVNGQSHAMAVRSDEVLLDTLRRELGLTSVRGTCRLGICGTCTVLSDGKPVSSCLMLTVMSGEASILTCEGLVSSEGDLDRVHEAFLAKGAYQCSFCIPGMVLTVRACLDDNILEPDQIRERLSGNLCRCGTYSHVMEAIHSLVDDASVRRR